MSAVQLRLQISRHVHVFINSGVYTFGKITCVVLGLRDSATSSQQSEITLERSSRPPTHFPKCPSHRIDRFANHRLWPMRNQIVAEWTVSLGLFKKTVKRIRMSWGAWTTEGKEGAVVARETSIKPGDNKSSGRGSTRHPGGRVACKKYVNSAELA